MLPKCQQAVIDAAASAGRKRPTKTDLDDIEQRIAKAQTFLAREDIAKWRGMTSQQRLEMAAERVAQDIQAAAQKKLQQAELQILKTAETEERLKLLQGARKGSRADALSADAFVTDRMVTSERKQAMGRLMDLIEASSSKEGASFGRKVLMTVFDAENPRMTADIVREIYKAADGSSGNPIAQKAARAWLDVIEEMRTRFNSAGGDVGALDYGYTPQPHDTARIRKAGADQWAQKTLPLLDRSRYLYEDGARISDDDMLEMLKRMHKTLESEGINKMEPGKFTGSGKRANRGSDSREIHFADGDSWVAYMQEFGRGSIYDAMMGHVGKMARDITLIERYGPDTAGQARLQFDEARIADGKSASDTLTDWHTVSPETYFRIIMGEVGVPKNEGLARTGSMVRNLQTAAKLGSAIVSAVTDLGTLAITAGYNRLPYWQLMKDIGAQNFKETRDFMSAHGMIADSIADNLNRWSGDHIGQNWSGKLANSVMRASLLNAWTDGLRQGFVLTMNSGLARLAKTDWASLTEFDRVRLERAGINEADWANVQKAPLTTYNGRELLTPQAIKESGNNALAAKVFGLIHDESEMAVINPDLTTRAVATLGGSQAGTLQGELARTVMQFKSFPIAMITRHWGRLRDGDMDAQGAPMMANRAMYAFALMATTMGLGAVATQAKQVLAGKDPIDMTPDDATGARFWAKATMQGGGLSILGDLFLVDPSTTFGDQAGNFAKNVLGPTIGSAADLVLKNISGNIWEASQGKDTHWEAELLQWARSNTPGASLWWVKPLVEHGFLNEVNESLSPGYLSKMEAKARKDWGGQRYYWAPDEGMPSRAPDLGAMAQ
jgi:hypothetical protein